MAVPLIMSWLRVCKKAFGGHDFGDLCTIFGAWLLNICSALMRNYYWLGIIVGGH